MSRPDQRLRLQWGKVTSRPPQTSWAAVSTEWAPTFYLLQHLLSKLQLVQLLLFRCGDLSVSFSKVLLLGNQIGRGRAESAQPKEL